MIYDKKYLYRVTDLDLHPAAEVVPQEVGGDRVEHVHLVRLEGDRLLVEVVPGVIRIVRMEQ